MNNALKQKLYTLPSTPGVYQFKDSQGEILYVGKAKTLRTRVQSYFRANADLDPAKQKMIPKIADLQTISTDNETEALVLEANLIRQHQPPYNVLLRDDKYYLFIKITTSEDYPRIFPVRRIKKDGARYFGPYSSASSVRKTLKLLRRIFPFKEEKESPRENIFSHPLFTPSARSDQHSSKSKAKLNQNNVELDQPEYQNNIAQIIQFLQGHRQAIIQTLKQGMKQASKDKHFERAAIFRDQLKAIERLEGTQKVFLTRKESFDVISIARNQSSSAVNVFAIREGKLLNKNTFLMKHRQSSSPSDTIRQFLLQYYEVAQNIPNTILIPEELDDQDAIANWINDQHPPTFLVPHRGKKKQLLTMGELNAQQILDQEEASFESDSKAKQATEELGKALHIKEPLHRIETYDISNIQGALATGSMVVFTDGKPDKAQYRKFRIKIDGKPDDFRMLQEVLDRRFSNKHSDWKKPNLVLIDGGKGQLSSTKKILDSKNLDINIASLAKREEELFLPNHPQSIRLPYTSPALYLVQRMRDEAHRFTITYHRLLRSKRSTKSILDEIPGIGPKTKKRLLNHFGSLKGIKSASDEELNKILGSSKTENLRDYL